MATTATPGSGARTAAAETRYVARFSRTERALHWIHASAFFVLLGSGLAIYAPALAERVGRRALVREIHLDAAIAWAVALVLVVALGDRRRLGETARELDVFDDDDRFWFRDRTTPQGRFNAGQKMNAALTAAFAVLFAVSGVLLWAGERNTRFRFDGTVVLHDGLTWISLVLVTGHLYFAVIHPRTRHSLRGITLGSVREDWAREHHPKWAPAAEHSPAHE